MSPHEAYDIYRSVRLHFESEKYDAIKYNFRVGGNMRAKPHEIHMFERLARKFPIRQTLIDFNVAYHVGYGKFYVVDLFRPHAQDCYLEWQKRRDSFMYQFKSSVATLSERYSLDELLSCGPDEMPQILKSWTREEISIEAVTIVDTLTNFMADHDRKTEDKIFWPEFYLKIRKYRPFLSHIDRRKCKEVLIHAFAKSKPLLT